MVIVYFNQLRKAELNDTYFVHLKKYVCDCLYSYKKEESEHAKHD